MSRVDIEVVSLRGERTSCCKSYLGTKGRCYNCVEMKMRDPDEEKLS